MLAREEEVAALPPRRGCVTFARPPERRVLRRILRAKGLRCSPDKRQSSRIVFAVPLSATFGSRLVHVLDLSSRGARIEHLFPLQPGRRRIFEFTCDGENVSIESEVVRCRLEPSHGKPVFRTGLRFLEPEPDTLWGVIASLAIERLQSTVA